VAETTANPKISTRNVNVYYGEKKAIDNVSIDVDMDNVTAFIGPSGCGKSTFLRSLNRMNDTIVGARVEGNIFLDGQDIYASSMDVVQLRARVGMVFQKPNPFPKSIYDNVAYGPRIHGLAAGKAELDQIVESALTRAGLWGEVKDRLSDSGTALSGGQQQQLAIARALAAGPKLLILDEPTEGIQPSIIKDIGRVIRMLARQGMRGGQPMAIVLVEQYYDFAEELADQYLVMERGEVVMRGRGKDMVADGVRQRMAI